MSSGKGASTMASRYEVEVTVGSAQDLKNVNWRNGDLKPYAVVWVDDGPKSSTHVDLHDGENPDWDEKLVIPVPPSSTRLDDAVLHIDIVHANASEGVKPLVGFARLPLRDILDGGAKIGSKVNRNLRLKRPSGRPQGRLDVRVVVREAANRSRYPDPAPYGHRSDKGSPAPAYAAPPVGYPAPAAAAGAYGGQPAPAYAAPSAPAYAAPSAPAYTVAAAAPPVVVAPVVDGRSRHHGSSMGAGTGLAVGAAAGMLGGLALAGGAHYVGGMFDDDCCDDDYYCDDDC